VLLYDLSDVLHLLLLEVERRCRAVVVAAEAPPADGESVMKASLMWMEHAPTKSKSVFRSLVMAEAVGAVS